MNKSQIASFKESLERLDEIDVSKVIADFFVDKENIDSLIIQNITTAQFVNITQKVLIEFQNILESDLITFLPVDYNYQNEYGSGNILNDIVNFSSFVKNNNLPQAEKTLLRMTYYQISNGIYDKSNIKSHNLKGIRVSQLMNKLNLIEEHLEKNIKLKEETFNEIENIKKDLTNLVNSKEEEFEQISENYNKSNSQVSSISDLLNKSTELNSRIVSIQEQQEKYLNDIENKLEAETKSYTEFKKQYEKLVNDLQNNQEIYSKQNKQFDEKLSYIESKKEFFEERNNYLDQLIGREVGASLFETFKQRKNELTKNITFWKYGIAVSILLLLASIWLIFWSNTEILNWEVLVIRSLKTIPFAILLYFVIRQYSKERNFQEEYALKSACALTIKAFADILEKNNKDNLILNAVMSVYKNPLEIQDKKDKEDGEGLVKTLMNLSETAKNFSKK